EVTVGSKQSEHEAWEFGSFRRISRTLSSQDSLNDILGTIAQEGLKLISASTVAIGIRSEDGVMIDFAAVAGDNQAQMLGLRIRCEDSLAESPIRTGQSATFTLPPARTIEPAASLQEFRNAAVVPIVRQGSIAGAICALTKQEDQVFD